MSDLVAEYCDALHQKFAVFHNLNGIYQIDITSTNFEESCKALLNKFDTVIALNVIEHIKDDSIAINNCKKLLKVHGRLIILVPAYQSLYNSLDKMLGHKRKYTKNTLVNRVRSAGLNIIHTQYFNLTGIVGRWFSGSILKNKSITANQLKLFNKLTSVFQLIDKLIFCNMGLPVTVISEK